MTGTEEEATERGDVAGTPRSRALGPGAPLRGDARVPGSKSLAIRALLAAALAGGRTRITNFSDGDDVAAALALVAAVGAEVTQLAPRAVAISGRPPGPHRGWAPTSPLEAGESGTLARLATAALALTGRVPGPYEVRVSGTLARRTSAPLLKALAEAGARFEPAPPAEPAGFEPAPPAELAGLEPAPPAEPAERAGAGPGLAAQPHEGPPAGWPLRVRPIGPPPELILRGPVSSQEASGLVLALAAWPGETRVVVEGPVPSRPYLDLTLDVLARFGARVELEPPLEDRDPRLILCVRGPLVPPREPFVVEPDASSAAVTLAAGCLSGGAVRVPGLGSASPQGDVAIVELLAAFGCEARAEADALLAGGRPLRGAELDLTAVPDLAPVLAAVAGTVALRAAAGEIDVARARTRLTGLATLEGKESPRITVLAAGLRALGLRVEASSSALTIAPPGEPLTPHPVELDPLGDHRMAFAFALLGLSRPGITILGPACVAKSWPGFWEELERLR